MKQIHKKDAPDFFLDFCHRNRPKVWEDIAPIRKELRGIYYVSKEVVVLIQKCE